MDAEIKETQKHHHVIYNLNTLETTLLCSAVVVLTAGIIFDSDYIWLPEFRISRSVITYGIVALIAASLVYYMLLTIREIRLATEKRKLRRKVRWLKLKNHMKIVVNTLKQHDEEKSKLIVDAQKKIESKKIPFTSKKLEELEKPVVPVKPAKPSKQAPSNEPVPPRMPKRLKAAGLAVIAQLPKLPPRRGSVQVGGVGGRGGGNGVRGGCEPLCAGMCSDAHALGRSRMT